MRSRRWLGFSLVGVLACGPSSGNESDGEADGSSASAGSEGEAGVDGEGGEAGESSADSGGSGTSETGMVGGDCGGVTCAPNEWCDWDSNTCGTESWDEGTCRPRPGACDGVFQPVCGCDGAIHSNECVGQSAGVDVDESGACELPPDTFPCGFRQCSVGFEYCRLGVSDVGGVPNEWQCVAIPDCAVVDCASCLANEPCGEICQEHPDGGFQVTCPGG